MVAEAAQAVPKWTNRYTSLGAETKSLLADDSVSELRKLVPLRKNNGHVFGTFCSTSLGGQGEGNLTTTDEAAAAETGVVLFRVQKEDVRGMYVSRATLSLHIRRYDLELDRVDFYFLDQA